ncbi:MAG: GNAT family N-acetyltransferase [Candidatus Riflebacteria bacterium]|nr:GNAT family N-acetyltransferase [Candidatus Riflebacteria bacterium]
MGLIRALSDPDDFDRALRQIRTAIYRHLPGWHDPPPAMEYQRFHPDREAFWKNHIGQTFVHEEKGVVNARVTVFLPNTSATSGRFGAFDCIDESKISDQIMDHASRWLMARGASRMEGPFTLSLHEDVGVLTRGFETPAPVFMPYNPGYYAGLLRQAGLHVARKFVTYRYDMVSGKGAFKPAGPEAEAIRLRPFDVKALAADTGRLLDVYNDAFQDQWGFTPLTSEDAHFLIRNLLVIGDPELTRIAVSGDETLGFILGVPDTNAYLHEVRHYPAMAKRLALAWALRTGGVRGCRVLYLAVRKRYQGKALSRLLVRNFLDIAREKGFRTAILSVDTESRQLRRLMSGFEMVLDKEYQIFGRDLLPAGMWPRVSGWSSRGVRGGR